MFTSTRDLRRPDRERLWAAFGTVCEETKQEQARERKAQKNDSSQKRAMVESKIENAELIGTSAEAREDLREATTLLTQAQEWMKDGWAAFDVLTDFMSTTHGRLTREDRDACWSRWQRAKAQINARREHLLERTFLEFRDQANEALNMAYSGEPRDAKTRVKEIQQRKRSAYMTREKFEVINAILDDAWAKASERLRERHREWRDKQEGHIQRWTELLEKNQEVLRRLEAQIDHCRDLESSARSEEFASQVRGWIEEKQSKVRDIENTNAALEEKIRNVKSGLTD
jgi:hypothetical protein